MMTCNMLHIFNYVYPMAMYVTQHTCEAEPSLKLPMDAIKLLIMLSFHFFFLVRS